MRSSFIFTSPLLNLRQHICKQGVVVFHAIIKVDRDVLIGKVMDFFFVLLDFKSLILNLFLLFGQLYTLRCRGMVNSICKVRELGAVTLLLFMHIVGTQSRKKVTLIDCRLIMRSPSSPIY